MTVVWRALSVRLTLLSIVLSHFFVSTVHAHELTENRAALVLRDDRLVSAILYLNLGEVLQKALMPEAERFEHTAKLSAMSETDFAKQFDAARKRIQSGVTFKSISGKPLPVSGWQWPQAREAQKHLREVVMRIVVTPGSHFHESPIEVRAQIQSDEPVASLRVEMPEALRPITVTATRPRQVRLGTATSSLVINF